MAYKSLKLWFDEALAIRLADNILSIKSDFNKDQFVTNCNKELSHLELKDRVKLFAHLLHEHLGADFKNGINVLLQILGPKNPKEIDMFKEYYWVMPIAKYVEDYGLNDFELSIKALEAITQRNTSEYAIRPFIQKYPNKTINQMLKWSVNPNFHVRRLASEGGRPRLPWANKLQQYIDDPSPLLPILQNLKDDPSKYVQKSVANCINDILKDNPVIAKDLINSWTSTTTKARSWIIKHAIRNLRKKNDPWAMNIMSEIT